MNLLAFVSNLLIFFLLYDLIFSTKLKLKYFKPLSPEVEVYSMFESSGFPNLLYSKGE